MALFQKSVLNKYLKLQDATLIEKAYKKYTKYFHNTKIQQNILVSKEEQFQQKFLIELFEKIFGYTIFPDDKHNITTEFKNLRGAKKADGAILVAGKAVCVIELKGTNTKDLESIRQQAFDYKSNHPTCKYIITSNFEKLRFYIETSDELEEFNLFTLSKKEFELLYLCVHKDNLLNNIPLQIKKDSIVVEEGITKKFYNDYSLFKRELFRDLVKLNVKNPVFRSELEKEDTERANKNIKLSLFKKSQKLIDRFLFIFFAEDRGLLPPNSTLQILENWNQLADLDVEVPLYDRFKLYFKYLDTGRAGTDKKAEIFAYNGGLFKPDAILDSLILDDNLLYKHTKTLSDYDFESQVDVNILGHIFENSLNEIESVNAEIEGTDFDKQKTKRKKDGVFYTPKYITKYIVDNTVGKLCAEKKTEFTIIDTEFTPNRQNATKKKLLANLESYRTWLLQITICDPACGSGAFLNQALDFLIKEHTYIDELQTKLLGGGFVFPNIENTVLENNIFGVDLNEESVEIAKLSLWLRTAQPRRKLNNLNSNIKCGNSLIDSKAVAGNKAFHWQKEFPKVFKEKDKKIYHITTAIHDSRTSTRMEKYKVRAQREMGTNPYPNVIYFTPEDDLLITQTIANIVTEDNLELLGYNICADHIHLLLACELEEIPAIMQKIKGRTSYVLGRNKADNKEDDKEGDKEVDKGDNKGDNKEDNREDNKGFKPLVENEKENKNEKANKPLWQQKYSAPKEVTTQEQLQNTLNYIQKNRAKHELPAHNKAVQQQIENMCCTVNTAFKPSYKGGFDVVIGNPPWGAKLDSKVEELLIKKYPEVPTKLKDSYMFFMLLCIDIIKENSFYGLIVPNTWLLINSTSKFRKKILGYNVKEIIDHGDGVFEDAVVESATIFLRKDLTQKGNVLAKKYQKGQIRIDHIINKKYWIDDELHRIVIELKEFDYQLIKKMELKSKRFDSSSEIIFGIKPYQVGHGRPKQSREQVTGRIFHSNQQIDKTWKPLVTGTDVNKYYCNFQNNCYIKYGEWLMYSSNESKILSSKILLRRTSADLRAVVDETQYYPQNSLFIITSSKNIHFVCGLINSKLFDRIYKAKCPQVGKVFAEVKPSIIKTLPIAEVSIKQENEIGMFIIEIQTRMEQFQNINYKFQTYLKSQYQLEKLSKKLQNWYELDFSDFIKELNKAIKAQNKLLQNKGFQPLANTPLTKLQEMDWMDVFEVKKAEAQTLKTQIDQTDKEIDAMVYALYGLTDDEISIVENS